jgi:sialate O-acetylesterase
VTRPGCTAFALISLLMMLIAPGDANVKLPALISDNMMLQRDIPVPIWGRAAPGERIKVAIGKQTASAVAGKDGRWQVRLKPMKAGGPLDMVVTGKNKLEVRNILVGEVWLCAGQSNMVMMVKQCDNAAQEIADAKNYPEIRHYKVDLKASPWPLNDTVGKWEVCSPRTVGKFTATGYFFARDIHDTLKAPVGIILSAWGGSNMESFVRLDVLKAHPESAAYFKHWEQRKAAFPAELAAAQKAAAEAKAAGKPAPKMRTLEGHQARPSSIYNAMISPLIPFGMRGVLWAGGKANRSRALEYRVLMPAMIQDWRKSWGLGDCPFFICQMANWVSKDPNEHWEELRESMLKTTDLKNAGMVVTIDIGDPNNVHPKNKQEVSRRLALQAKANVYGMDVVCNGPIYTSMTVEGNAIRLHFKSIGGGLAARVGGSLKGFVIAGADRKFVPAGGTIDGDTILVRSENVRSPIAVRYAWEMNPDCNLMNKAGLPASPFRTDAWPFWQGVQDKGSPDDE